MTSEKPLLSFPKAFIGRYPLGHPIIENYIKNGFPPGARGNDNPRRCSFSEISNYIFKELPAQRLCGFAFKKSCSFKKRKVAKICKE
ncbi:MAG: hypothetical protein IPH77_08355 [Ignavibacteria bacterium]|nr:hypothetical protein [Ignavibacteria bacterium]